MNAIILIAGKSSRMYEGGVNIHKGLLPILGVPNIERTILMLHMLDIYEIVVATPYDYAQFDYIKEKYLCTIIHIPPDNQNTLTTMNYLIEYIGDTFIIEGDVVCTKNIFKPFEYSTYYTMKYPYPEFDEWNVITDSNNNITRFEIGNHLTPAIFGISFWTQKDSLLLKKYIKAQLQNQYAYEPDFFWDDNISELLHNLCIKTYEITFDAACEMNTVSEYQYANNLCEKILTNPVIFFNNIYIKKATTSFLVYSSSDKEKNLKWLKKLFNHYNQTLEPYSYDYWYNPNELVFVIKNDNNEEISFFSFIVEKKYILLRRLYIDLPFRMIGLGKAILNYLHLFAISCKKDLRVNVYDENAIKFYTHLGAQKLYSTYYWKIIETDKGGQK